jgi:phospholipid/cholesterol/gamma-HCH transport system ATP-binding protein
MIELVHIKKSFEGKSVLKDVNLKVNDGEILVIMGESGCGKTVLIRSIIGLIKPDAGKIIVDGDEITQMDRKQLFNIRKKFGMLFQSAALFDSMTVEQNIGLALQEHTDLSKAQIQKKVSDKLNVVNLSDVEKKKPAELSGGMKKRVGLARALIMDPKYVLFDEPTTGLDPIIANSINNLILTTSKILHITSIVVTHDMHSAFKIGDRIAMLSQGEIVFQGTPSEVKRTKNQRVQQFITGRVEV